MTGFLVIQTDLPWPIIFIGVSVIYLDLEMHEANKAFYTAKQIHINQHTQKDLKKNHKSMIYLIFWSDLNQWFKSNDLNQTSLFVTTQFQLGSTPTPHQLKSACFA